LVNSNPAYISGENQTPCLAIGIITFITLLFSTSSLYLSPLSTSDFVDEMIIAYFCPNFLKPITPTANGFSAQLRNNC
jgi:hypothetical protein